MVRTGAGRPLPRRDPSGPFPELPDQGCPGPDPGRAQPGPACRCADQRCCMTAVTELRSLSYLARRGVAAQWRGFLRALIETLDANLDAASRDALLRAVGARMSGTLPLAACDWGWVEISLDPQDRSLV